MLNLIWSILSIFIIILILLKVPNNTGLGSMINKTNFLGSPNSTEKVLSTVIWVFIAIYLLLAIKFNLTN